MSEDIKMPFSKHIFMFAFKWNNKDGICQKKSKTYREFNEKVDLKRFDEKIKKLTRITATSDNTKEGDKESAAWETFVNRADHIADYNEYTYYYHNVRDAIYGDIEHENVGDEKVNIYTYTISKEDDAHYIIKTLLKNKPNKEDKKEPKPVVDDFMEKEYRLEVTKIELKVYDTGVGILSYFCENYYEASIEAINRINDYGRRIYPQFIAKQGNVSPTQKTKETFLASAHILKLGKHASNHFIETYSSDYETEGNRVSNIIMGLLGKGFKTGKHSAESYLGEDVITISPLIDDRMFVICWYANDELSEAVQKIEKIGSQDYYSYIANDKWYEYIFMEQEKNCQSKWMMQDILKNHTYERWIEYGTLYGMSYCSFVCLTDHSDFAIKNVSIHVTTIYYQMMCLILAQKASIFRFEEELTDISNQSKNIPVEAVEEVYQNYLQFINGIYFREITAQDQGIELYIMAQNLMRIDIDVKELKEEIGQLFQYVSLRADKETNRAINSLTYLNTLIVVPTLVTGFFGMNIFGTRMLEAWNINDYKKLVIWACLWIVTVGILPIALIRTKSIRKLLKKMPEKFRSIIPWTIAFIAVLVSVLLLYL